MDILTLIFGTFIGFIIGIFMMRIVSLHEHREVRRTAVRSSRGNIFWEVYEKILPALPNFPFNPKDMTFVGKGIDYIIFDGLSEGRLKEIIFLEIKSGKSSLNPNERAIQSAINHHRVRYAEYRMDHTKNKE